MRPRVLVVAGSDSGGGAGVQADIKACAAFGVYAATAITAVTVQDTRRVHAVHAVPPDLVAHQVRVVLDDVGADVVKIGMLGSVATVEAVAGALGAFGGPIVLDPVLVATSGDALGDEGVADAIRDRLVARAGVVTPNREELSRLTGREAGTYEAAERAAHDLLAMGAGAVLAKGGHGEGDVLADLLVTADGAHRFEHPRLGTRHTHGTGCTLASALAAAIALGDALPRATRRAVAYVAAAIEHAPGLGRGHGPVEHALTEGRDGWAPLRPR